MFESYFVYKFKNQNAQTVSIPHFIAEGVRNKVRCKTLHHNVLHHHN